jgi:phosphoribosylformylglycinamidine synthase subunit PurQ / glutaminase
VKFGVVRFPGSCDESDAMRACRLCGDAELVWHGRTDISDVDVVVIPGGFSYGDYLRPGAIARFSPVMGAIERFAADGGLVLGICNGFQVLCEAGLLPGALVVNTGLRFVCRQTETVCESAYTAFTQGLAPGRRLSMPVKHSAGRYYAPPSVIAQLEANAQIAFRYVPESNPNGSIDGIAGVLNAEKNVCGLMPHPEHAVSDLDGSSDGMAIFQSLAAHLKRPRR